MEVGIILLTKAKLLLLFNLQRGIAVFKKKKRQKDKVNQNVNFILMSLKSDYLNVNSIKGFARTENA